MSLFNDMSSYFFQLVWLLRKCQDEDKVLEGSWLCSAASSCVSLGQEYTLSGFQWHSPQRRKCWTEAVVLYQEQVCSPGLEILLTVRNDGNGDTPEGHLLGAREGFPLREQSLSQGQPSNHLHYEAWPNAWPLTPYGNLSHHGSPKRRKVAMVSWQNWGRKVSAFLWLCKTFIISQFLNKVLPCSTENYIQ